MTGTDSDLVVLKLGGSVITDKDSPETVDDEALHRVLDAVASTSKSEDGRLVVVHGGGSFGHVHAADHGVSTTTGTSDAAAATAIHGAMKRLNGVVVDRLQERGVAALPVHPLSVAARDAEGVLSLPAGATEGLLEEGFVPVLHGDVIAHANEGVTVLSGDEIVTSLADSLGASRVGLCSTVPGVLDEHDAVIEEVRSFEDVASVLGDSESTDVSGGMAGKVQELLDLGAPAHIFGPDAVGDFLTGERAGTLVDGR
ncbi:isopentenyl phosphate kinase [Halohasta litorea]|uniref:Isopentenyl phosphate kinase n=1 Tax=Halohasta litorea TaxID=869891 RepID=A0ABD6DCL1_9EURY|nr:isopentenyl phosphate kinase [Halohasta litorea]